MRCSTAPSHCIRAWRHFSSRGLERALFEPSLAALIELLAQFNALSRVSSGLCRLAILLDRRARCPITERCLDISGTPPDISRLGAKMRISTSVATHLFVLSVLLASTCVSHADVSSDCGEPPRVDDTSLEADVKGKANLLSKYIGDTELSGKLNLERKDIFSKYKDDRATRADALLYYQICAIIDKDPKLSSTDKVKILIDTRKQFESKPVSSHISAQMYLAKDSGSYTTNPTNGMKIPILDVRETIRGDADLFAGSSYWIAPLDQRIPPEQKCAEGGSAGMSCSINEHGQLFAYLRPTCNVPQHIGRSVTHGCSLVNAGLDPATVQCCFYDEGPVGHGLPFGHALPEWLNIDPNFPHPHISSR